MTDPEPLAVTAANGDRYETLQALRGVLAEAIDAGPPPRDLAALSRRLLEVLAELDGMRAIDDELEQLLSVPRRADGPTFP